MIHPTQEIYPADTQDPIAVLMSEHRLIERVLGSLVAFAGDIQADQPDARARLIDYTSFFRNFADRHHHGKEEDQLFQAMAAAGFPTQQGPIAVMLHEHALGREHVRALARIGAGSGPLSAAEIDTLRDHAYAFGELLSAHIGKEDQVLFRLAAQALDKSMLTALAAGFDAFQATANAAGEIERLIALGERLIEACPVPTGFLERVPSASHGGA